MIEAENIGYITALASGVLTFFSPCILPIIPGFLALVAGLSTEHLDGKRSILPVIVETIGFVLGISTTFIALGYSAGLIGSFLIENRLLISKIGGIIAIALGLGFIFNFNLPYFNFKFKQKGKPRIPFVGSFIFGTAFGIGWSPCIGPILATILIYAASYESAIKGAVLLLFYSLGFGIPFILTAVAINKALDIFDKMQNFTKIIKISAGLILIFLGIKMLL